ncbi:hypothetical protein KBX26_00615 [Micromonospora sp. C97]|uniref:hypothetical protein n=1 Tax=Micromonospora sp. C97 TaxID=2824883 RepID=UPI001B369AD1|nr:hypothetical protein [Micromonospora sp. C97]MBQ1028509.1 hypothetical protein [Micromonospora sp. C97]
MLDCTSGELTPRVPDGAGDQMTTGRHLPQRFRCLVFQPPQTRIQMSYPTPRRRPRSLARIAVAVACASVMTFSGLPVLTGGVEAAPKAKRCDEMYGVRGDPAKPGGLPADSTIRREADWDEYEFDNPRQAMDGLTLPSDPAERTKFLDEIGEDSSRYKEGDPKRVYATYNNNQKNGTRPFAGTFDEWLNEVYIENYARNRRGAAFTAKIVRDLNLVGPDWLCEEYILDKDGKTIRKYDAANHRTKEFVEFKSGGAHDTSQPPKDRVVLKDPRYQDYKLRYAFGQEQEPKTRTAVRNLGADIGNDAQGRPRVTTYEHRSTAVVRYTPGPHSRYDSTLNAKPGVNQGSRGGGNDMINRSAPNPETARQQIERARQLDTTGQRVRGPGGVDFSTLELRFVGAPVKGEGLDYSFSAKKMPDPDTNPGAGGKEKAELVSDSFFTWLALTPDKFWVNLNPDQPDKIMDDRFGETDAGRVLLEADLDMKHDFAQTMNPSTDRGARFWDSLSRVDGRPCLHSIRNWIVPQPAQVREQDGGIYILDAPLKVNSVPQEVNTPVPGGTCDLTKAQIEHNQSLVNTMILPEVEKKINNHAAYADLRRVYTSRVAAEWIRLQDAEKATDYRAIINSNEVSRWPIRGAKWDKNETWQRYLKSFKEGDYSFEREYGGRVYVYTVGGVDFSQAPKKNITKSEFTTAHPHLPRTTQTSVKAMTDDAETKNILYLGGNTTVKASRGGGATPEPPSNDGGSGGGLPITGDSLPVGLVLTFAAALIAVGSGMLWWTRRRRRFQS